MIKSEKTIYFVLALVVISWGLNIVMVKYLTQFISPMFVAAIRMPLAGIVLLPFVFKKYGFYKPNAKQWGLLFLIGLTSIFFSSVVFSIRGCNNYSYKCIADTRIKSVIYRAACIHFRWGKIQCEIRPRYSVWILRGRFGCNFQIGR